MQVKIFKFKTFFYLITIKFKISIISLPIIGDCILSLSFSAETIFDLSTFSILINFILLARVFCLQNFLKAAIRNRK